MSNSNQAMQEAEDVFREGSFIGATYQEIEESGYFGQREYTHARSGRWNLWRRLEFGGNLEDRNPYRTEVGFFSNKEAACFLIRKRALARGQRMSNPEIVGHLERVAWGGEWDSGNTGDYPGTFWIYQHTVNEITFLLFAYLPPSRRQLAIYAPSVSPNLDGQSRAPLVFLPGS